MRLTAMQEVNPKIKEYEEIIQKLHLEKDAKIKNLQNQINGRDKTCLFS